MEGKTTGVMILINKQFSYRIFVLDEGDEGHMQRVRLECPKGELKTYCFLSDPGMMDEP